MRDHELQHFLTASGEAFEAGRAGHPVAAAFAARVFAASEASVGVANAPEPVHPAACDHLPAALENAARSGRPVATVGDAFARVAPRLEWRARPTGPGAPEDFAEAHANACIVGVDGLEIRDDIRIGVSLVAPETRYPDHDHPPEEAYLALSPGEWWNAETPWHEPGPGGLVHNPPGISHAMRSGAAPLLAIWCLWTAGL